RCRRAGGPCQPSCSTPGRPSCTLFAIGIPRDADAGGGGVEMQRMTAFVLGVVAALAAGPSRAADVHVNVNIGAPSPPPVVVQAPPRLVVVPDVPAVRYAPEAPVNFFVYGGRSFSFHDGAWFVATTYGAPWVYVPTVEVPRAVRVVPARYYRI